jgi:phage shock protein E
MRLGAAVIFLMAALAASAWAQHTKDSLDDVKKNLAEGKAVLVDVREQKEWDRGHLQDARLLPISQLNRSAGEAGFKDQLAKQLPKDRIVYCHCAKGVRAAMAGETLRKLGYDARAVKAGYDELRAAGFPIAPQGTPK